jgi:integrase
MKDTKRINFTAGRVSNFTCPPDKSQAFMWDSDVPGLGLRVTRAGAAAYVYQCRIHDKSARVTIGSRDAWDIEGARKEARRLAVLVDNGTDPRQEREDKAEAHAAKQEAKAAKVRETTRQAVTLGELWPLYIEDRRPHWGALHLKDHQAAVQAPGVNPQTNRTVTAGGLWPLHDTPLNQLTQSTLKAWLVSEKASRPTVTARNFRLLRAFLRWCDEQEAEGDIPDLRGLVPGNALGKKTKENVPKSAKKKDRLERDDLGAWLESVGAIESAGIRHYLAVLLLTGARRTEILELQWEHVNFRRRLLTIRDKAASRGGQDGRRTIPMPPYIEAVLKELERLNKQPPTVRHLRTMDARGESWKPSAWVFSSLTSSNGRLQEPRIAHNRAVEEAGLPHLTLHGLRRTFAVMAEAAGAPKGAVMQIMGHTINDIHEGYKPRTIEELRMWHTKIEGWILEQAGIEQPAVIEAAPAMRRVK